MSAITTRYGEVITKSSISLVKNGERVTINMDDVTHFKADSKYVSVFALGMEYIIGVSLVKLEAFLGDAVIRAHRSCLVVPGFISEFKGESWRDDKSSFVLLRQSIGFADAVFSVHVSRQYQKQIRETHKKMLARHQKAS